MAQQPGYPPQGYTNPEYMNNGTLPGHDGAASPPNADGAQTTTAAGRRKRQYAGQAYDFGAGANSALGGQQQGGGSFSSPPGVGYEGYNPQAEQASYQQPSYGGEYAAPAAVGQSSYGQPAPPIGGYQPPDPGYPGQGAPSAVGGITQGMASMGISGQPPQGPGQAQQRPHLNQLYPTDMLNQPFNVAELDLPPPPIVLPPNVSTKFKGLISVLD